MTETFVKKIYAVNKERVGQTCLTEDGQEEIPQSRVLTPSLHVVKVEDGWHLIRLSAYRGEITETRMTEKEAQQLSAFIVCGE